MTSDATGFDLVERLLAQLAKDGSSFASSTSASYRIESYEPGFRLRISNINSSRWIDVDDVRGCWAIFERKRSINREDVLDPGRASAFMLALFGQLPCTAEAPDGALEFV